MKSSHEAPSNKYLVPVTKPPRTEGGTPCGAVVLDERLTTAHPTSAGPGVSIGRDEGASRSGE